MGKLSHLYPNGPVSIDGFLDQVIDNITSRLSDIISPKLDNNLRAARESGVRADNAVNSARADIQRALRDEMSSLKPEIRKVLKALESSNRDMVGLQGRLVNALGNVQIPDYSAQLSRLERSQPDLSPILVAIERLERDEDEEEPKEWAFDVKRSPDGLIQSVTAKAK